MELEKFLREMLQAVRNLALSKHAGESAQVVDHLDRLEAQLPAPRPKQASEESQQ